MFDDLIAQDQVKEIAFERQSFTNCAHKIAVFRFCFFQAREFDIHPNRESRFFTQPRQIFPHTAAVLKHFSM